jgi:Copper amine oxidase N-terminal domain
MKRLSTGILAALIAAFCGLSAVAAPSTATQGNNGNGVAQTGSPPPADFGSPPSGQIPILYNDHHVYSKPDVLKQGRVLAALVKGGTLLIPLRSMFEQMGATVSYDAGSKTATVSKPGAEVKVTVGKPEVIINGESRPLDVPPIIYQGAVLVPVRVISEGMGAYVQWVPDKRLVVVRYIPATPPPSPAPPPPAPPPPPPPPPTPRPQPNVLFLAGDYLISPKVYNEFSPGNTGTSSWTARGGVQFNAIGLPFMLEVDYKNWQYPHNCGSSTPTPLSSSPECYVTTIGSRGSSFVPAFTAVNRDFDTRLGVKVLDPHIYVAIGYIWTSNNYGYPNMNAVGGGIEKLPDWGHAFTYYGSVYYYPNVRGTYATTATSAVPSESFGIGYNVLKYQVGIAWAVIPAVYIDAGWAGENYANKNNAPISQSFNGPYAGLGFLIPF